MGVKKLRFVKPQKFLPLHFILLLISISVTSCGAAEYQEVRVEDLFIMELPAGMEQVAHLNNAAVLQYRDPVQRIYVVVIADKKEEVETDFLDLGLQDYFDFALRNIEQNLQDSLVSTPADTIIEDCTFLTVEITGRFQEKQLFYKIAVSETQDYYFQILTYTEAARKREILPTMNQILYSFRPLSDSDN